MLITFLNSDRIKSEAGVYQILLPIIAIAVLAVLTILGLDGGIVKKASAMLSNHTESICKTVVSRPTIQRQAAQSFAAQINSFVDSQPSRLTINSASLIIPTMPQYGDFMLQTSPASGTQPSDPSVSFPANFKTLLPPGHSCRLKCDAVSGQCADCTFYGDIRDPYLQANYPRDLWDNLLNAGSIVGCEIHATVHSISGEKPIEAKSVWIRNVRGVFDAYDPSTIERIKETAPGLSIAIAPQLTTDASDMRFRFSSNYSERASFDPLYRMTQSWEPFKAKPPFVDFRYSTTARVQQPDLISNSCRSGLSGATNSITCPIPDPLNPVLLAPHPSKNKLDVPAPPNGPPGPVDPYDELPGCSGTASDNPGVNCLWMSDREEMLVACMNPVILLRNMFLSTVTELAARHGQLRQMTQLLMVATENRDLVNNSNLNSPPKIPNNPVEIVKFGDDLVPVDSAQRYTIPFVFFDSGRAAGPPPIDELDPTLTPVVHKGGLIDPFNTDPLFDPRLRDHHALIAGQLRYCYHLWEGSATPGEGLDRYRVPALENANFQPPVYDFNNNLRPTTYQAGDVWDQDCPWGPYAGCNQTSKTRLLTAPELVSSLGSVQSCPYEEGGLPSQFPGGISGGICKKPGPGVVSGPPLDLHADILGLLYHLAGAPLKAPNQPDPSDWIFHSFPSRISPGISPLDPAAATRWFPFTSGSNNIYKEAVNLKTPILLVLHQRLVPSEVSAIKSLTDRATGVLKDRPITVVYLPANAIDADPTSLDNLRTAFSITSDITDPQSKTENAIFNFSPNMSSLTNESRTFRNYWADLLNFEREDNMEISARNIFYDRLLTMELRL